MTNSKVQPNPIREILKSLPPADALKWKQAYCEMAGIEPVSLSNHISETRRPPKYAIAIAKATYANIMGKPWEAPKAA